MHDCPFCGQACDCDGEDVWRDTPDECIGCGDCEDSDYDTLDLDWIDEGWEDD